MSAENRRLVINAIKDGTIKIVPICALRRRDEFCVWGGVCEVYRRTTGNGEWHPMVGPRVDPCERAFHHAGMRHNFYAPIAVHKWLGILGRDGLIDCVGKPDPSKAVIEYLEAAN